MPAAADPRLSEEEIRNFHDRGWVVREALFRRDEVARIRHAFDKLEALAEALSETGLCQGSHFVLEDAHDIGTPILIIMFSCFAHAAFNLKSGAFITSNGFLVKIKNI